MNTRPRLFARSREEHRDIQQFTSENFIVALLDPNVDDISLRQILNCLPNIHYFRARNTNNCLELINQDDAKNAIIIVITSVSFINFIQTDLLENSPQIESIYFFEEVLCNKVVSNDQRYCGTFDNIQLLYDVIFSDLEDLRRCKNLGESIEFLLEDDARFVWYRFFFHILDRLEHTDIAKRELISRLYYLHRKHAHQLHAIKEFEKIYRSEYAIWWYTQPRFALYLTLNQTMRCHDINEIFLWRVYIQDLDRSLRQVCSEQKDAKSVCLYRGQGLPVDDVNRQRNSLGKLILMTSFLSTSLNAEVARLFAHTDSRANPPLTSVLYRIMTDLNSVKTVCADVQHISDASAEEEHLFSIRSLFRIERVEFFDEVWYIDLTAVDEDDPQFCTTINPWKAVIGEQSFFSGRSEPLFTRYLNVENGSFIAFQLLVDLILRLKQTKYAREEMLAKCRAKYSHSQTDLQKIDEFEQTYNNNDASKWYTVSSFIYRLINKTLRMEDIDTLFKLRYYIHDLHNQLAQLQLAYIQSLPNNEPILTLYRGQRMKIIDLHKLRQNIGKLISMNSFLSTTTSVLAALFFSGDGALDDSETEASVLYQITVDTSVPHSIPFAEINYLSVCENEDEVLFSMASFFEVCEIEPYGNLWVVNLTLINKEDEVWNRLTAHLDA